MDNFNYLAVIIISTSEEKVEIQQRITKGIKCMGVLVDMLRSKNIAKCEIMMIIRSVVIYGEEKGKNGFKGYRNKGMAQEN